MSFTTHSTIEALRPVDDTFFHKLAEHKEFCEELLRTILEMPDLQIVETVPQRSLRNVKGRSVFLDTLCRDRNNTYFNVEVQKEDNDDHQKRVRYNSSNIDTFITEKGIRFKELPDVYIIYISCFDIFKEGKTIYHIDRTIRETGTTVYNGLHEIYVNTEINDGTDIAGLMDLLNTAELKMDSRFPQVCNSIQYYKKGKGQKNMCEVVEQFAKEYAKEYAIQEQRKSALEMIRLNFDNELICRITRLPLEEILALYKDI